MDLRCLELIRSAIHEIEGATEHTSVQELAGRIQGAIRTLHAAGFTLIPNPPTLTLSKGAKCVINIWQNEDRREALLHIACSESGKRWCRVKLFIEMVCGKWEVSDFQVRDLDRDLEIICHEDLILSPGNYVLIPKEGMTREYLKAIPAALTILPKGSKLQNDTAVSSRCSTPRDDNPVGAKRAADLITKSPRDTVRASSFRESLLQRDNHCIICGEDYDLTACHIVAIAWWAPLENRRYALPITVRNTIAALTSTINDIQNGILLSEEYARAFDSGTISFEYVDDRLQVVSLSPANDHIDGQVIEGNWRIRSSGPHNASWWAESSKPNKKLLRFHLQCSVFKHMRGSGLAAPDSDDDDESECKPLSQSMAPQVIDVNEF